MENLGPLDSRLAGSWSVGAAARNAKRVAIAAGTRLHCGSLIFRVACTGATATFGVGR